MKKFIPFLCMLLLAIACKKDSEPAPVPLISRVTVNGGIAYKFYYNTDNQIIRWELYGYETVGNPLNAEFELEYSNGKLSTLSSFSEPGKVPSGRLLFEYDDNGRIIGHERYDLQGADPSEPDTWGVYQYATNGRLSSVTIREENGDLRSRYNLTYFDDGALKQRDEYDETVTNQLRLVSRVIYSLPLNVGVTGWEPISVIPLDGDEITRTVRYDGIQRYSYTGGVLTNNRAEVISAREYNADGTLKRHVHTHKKILPASADVVNNWEFEYIQQ